MILPDGTTQGSAIGAALQQGIYFCSGVVVFTRIITLQTLSQQTVTAEIGVGGSFEFVGAAFGDGIDGRSGEAGLTNIVGGNLNGQLLQRIQGKRVEKGGHPCAVETEKIIDA